MNLSGWIMMILSVGFATGLLSWCIYRIIKGRNVSKHLRSQADIDTHDRE